ncbi:MAG: dihydropteroate synthase [Anaerolineales bacterium]|nr:dihydropteroate synthase [Anaerolineales bacterium]
MGIINATPDSFSGDGLNSEDDPVQAAILLAQRLVADGAHLLDVGGESTRPGATPVSAETELNRVTPIIKALAATVEVPISIDTSKATVARSALDAGASIVNDVSGLMFDNKLGEVVASRGAALILMHNRSRKEDASSDERLGGRYVGSTYDKLIEDISRDLEESITIAFSAGIDKNQIILDPGIGFGKTVEQNLRLLNELGKLENLGYPLLIGPSRKSFIGYTLDLQMEDRLEGTAAAVAVGITRGADIVRVHDVREMVRVAQMTDALVRPVQD